MPTNVVKTKTDERRWQEAKRIVNKEYPKINPSDNRYYALVMGIFKRMNPRRFGRPRTEAERRARHKRLFGTAKLPPRGTGLKMVNPRMLRRAR